ncbi:hypothetical protein [Goodfellowiella coeruleoviolacea]|uniref:LysE type translocator n=1 Tax=Goodfellowiella coeruleoviolacea TaxID=334858 RepID=A0AAE3KPT9_9PSEU|nr:hypothetical protein [Goodfellowiella coeruleoviolacea]MCP2170228.1 hypothetical protein [Goodfellowiella coeruleoviolacea]
MPSAPQRTQFVNPELGHVGVQFLVLGLSAVLVGLSTDGSIGLLAGRIGGLLRRSRRFARWLNLFAGTVFAALAARLVAAPEQDGASPARPPGWCRATVALRLSPPGDGGIRGSPGWRRAIRGVGGET